MTRSAHTTHTALHTKLIAIAIISSAMVLVCELGDALYSSSNPSNSNRLGDAKSVRTLDLPKTASSPNIALKSALKKAPLIRWPGTGTSIANAQGQSFFTSSPGLLTREHKGIDNQDGCDDCHVGNTKRVDDSKCLNCHDHQDLRSRIKAGNGLHSTSKVKGQRCFNCHLEHQGRSYNIMGWRGLPPGENGFDHKLSGWPLKDKHAVLKCADCHKKRNKAGRRTFLGENQLCGSCHRRDQPHRFDRKHNMKCERCHTEISWKPRKRSMAFDHNKKSDAEFPQEGAHKEVTCRKCHPKNEFNLRFKTPGNCRNCHKSTHKGHLFDTKRCDWCHSPKQRQFKQFQFDHAARTRFKLSGAHGKVECYNCHTKERAKVKPQRACVTCHAKDNKHKDRFNAFGNPPRCETCHNEGSFKGKKKFNHGKNTKFRLTGKHARTECRGCHRGSSPDQFERFNKTIPGGRLCKGCHQHKNVHPNDEYTDLPKSKAPIGSNGKKMPTCLDCHVNAGSIEVRRDNEYFRSIHGRKGTWPLTNNHADVACAKCHENDEFKDTPSECATRCHEDSLHEGRLGDECSRCHQPGIWKAVRFDHVEDSTWPLLGLHETVPKCVDCHPGHPQSKKYKGIPTNCAGEGCHAKDDVHRKRLGDKCEQCHLETGENIFDHNAQSEFKLDGAHLTTQCSDCHPSITFKPRPTDCFGGGVCHAEPEVHKGQFGTVCDECHNTTTFKNIKPLHDVGDFSLNGAHDRLECKNCHLDARPLAGSGNFCINCHRQDDIHSNSLSPRCGECHTQWSFAPARFDHSSVGCNLSGLHRALPCYDCHQSGNFGGLAATCGSCHVDQARAVPITAHTGVTTCASCHNINYWSPSSGGGGTAWRRESVCL